MLYKVKVAVCSEICTKHIPQCDHHVEFFNLKCGGTYNNHWALKGYLQHVRSRSVESLQTARRGLCVCVHDSKWVEIMVPRWSLFYIK
jgi:hypothetical protein